MSESRDLVAAGRKDEGGGRPSGTAQPTDGPTGCGASKRFA